MKAIVDRQIYLLQFENSYRMSATLMRFQEYYESPKFRGKIFSWEEFMDYYAKKHGEFSYLEDFVGFNFPSEVLQPFYDGKFYPLTEKEEGVLNLFKIKEGRFYIVGTTKNCDLEDLRHEIVHGLFYTRIDYQKTVLKCLKKFNTKTFKNFLQEIEYHPSIHNDEINAYCLTGLGIIMKRKKVRKLIKELSNIFYQFFGFRANKGNKKFWLKLVKVINL